MFRLLSGCYQVEQYTDPQKYLGVSRYAHDLAWSSMIFDHSWLFESQWGSTEIILHSVLGEQNPLLSQEETMTWESIRIFWLWSLTETKCTTVLNFLTNHWNSLVYFYWTMWHQISCWSEQRFVNLLHMWTLSRQTHRTDQVLTG